MDTNSFLLRHIGSNKEDLQGMLDTIGLSSIDELIEQTIPSSIRLKEELHLGDALSEQEFLAHIKELAQKNKQFKTYIGLQQYCPSKCYSKKYPRKSRLVHSLYTISSRNCPRKT